MTWSYFILRAIPVIHERNALRYVLPQRVSKFPLKSIIALCVKNTCIQRSWDSENSPALLLIKALLDKSLKARHFFYSLSMLHNAIVSFLWKAVWDMPIRWYLYRNLWARNIIKECLKIAFFPFKTNNPNWSLFTGYKKGKIWALFLMFFTHIFLLKHHLFGLSLLACHSFQ